ncbi:MAG: hypothetical protein ACTSPB_17270 [Candidatus Thorarchaeota archaeon]
MGNALRTSIFTTDESDFRKFLEEEGFSDFLLSAANESGYLNIQFQTDTGLFNYKLRGVETRYRSMRSNKYYYDLDQNFDDEADEFFGNDSDDI